MRKQFYFPVLFCLLLSTFLLSVDATEISNEDNLWKYQNQKYREATQAAIAATNARILESQVETYYTLNAQEINKGKRMLLGSVIKAAATVVVTYVSGGSTVTVTVLTSMEPLLKMFDLYGSINTRSDLESAYESALSNLRSRVWEASAAIARYRSAWNSYSLVLTSHNSRHHGSGGSPSDSAHEVDSFTKVTLNENLPSFLCPDGSCGLTWDFPSSAREAHYVKCGTKDDPYDRWLKGCRVVYYTCNTNDVARHKPNDCGLEKWVRKNGVWSKSACTSDYRKCTQNSQRHATVLGTNQISLCGPASSSSSANKSGSISPSLGSSSASAGSSYTVNLTTSTPFSSVYWYIKSSGTSGLGSSVETDNGGSSSYSASMTYTFGSSDSGDYIITAYIYDYSDNSTYQVERTVSVDETPNCSDCTSHCSSPCSCTNSGTCNGTVSTPPTPTTPPPEPEPTTVACGGASYTGCSGASSRTEHHVPLCSNGCGNGYWTCSTDAPLHTEEKTCKRSGCSATLTPCKNGPSACVRPGHPDNWHWL